MLRNIPEILPPELMLALMQMGHGDEITLGDSNFPSMTMSNRCVYTKGIRMAELLDAILQFLPLDTFVDTPVTLMRPTQEFDGTPPIWREYEAIIKKNDFCGAFKEFAQVERQDFYEKAKSSFVTVQTSETALFGCIILTKGVIGPTE